MHSLYFDLFLTVLTHDWWIFALMVRDNICYITPSNCTAVKSPCERIIRFSRHFFKKNGVKNRFDGASNATEHDIFLFI